MRGGKCPGIRFRCIAGLPFGVCTDSKFKNSLVNELVSDFLTFGSGITVKVPPPAGGIDSGMPNAPRLLSFMVVRSSVGAGRL